MFQPEDQFFAIFAQSGITSIHEFHKIKLKNLLLFYCSVKLLKMSKQLVTMKNPQSLILFFSIQVHNHRPNRGPMLYSYILHQTIDQLEVQFHYSRS